MISGTPLVMGNRLIVQSESGDIAAFTVRLPEQPAPTEDSATDSADEES